MSTATRTIPSPLDKALAAGNWPALRPDGVWVVESSSLLGTDRRVKLLPDGIMTCSCPAGQNGVPDCKHRAAVRWCLAHNVRAAFHLCTGCGFVRVAKPCLCPDCAAKAAAPVIWCVKCASAPVEAAGEYCAMCADYLREEAARQPRVFACGRGRKVAARPAPSVCPKCGMQASDPLHDAFCA